MPLLQDLHVVQLGEGVAAAVCGRWLADAGASVSVMGPDSDSTFARFLDRGKIRCDDPTVALQRADLIICEGRPCDLAKRGHDPDALHQQNPTATIALISPFGQTGPRANQPATDLSLFCASGMARLLTGQVNDVSEPPIYAVGHQSAIIGGLAAACAALAAVVGQQKGSIIDVSLQEALATLAAGELAQGGLSDKTWSRKRLTDGNGATVTILPARDGYVAVSPREESQWGRWLAVMGTPDWGRDARFQSKSDRIANWDVLHALMSEWSVQHGKQWIADQAQAAHVPSFPLGELVEHLNSEQLDHRCFFRPVTIDGHDVKAPGPPFRLKFADTQATPAMPRAAGRPSASKPLNGIRVLDFSWVIAGPTTTRHLAALGAEVIKVEAPGAGDPARQSHLHTVLGQGKKSIVLDLKKPAAVDVAKALVAQSDILVENFATGVMARLGLDGETLKAANPDLIYISASGLGRTGPSAAKVAYGTLLQSYSGFAGLNRHPGKEPRIGFAWLDPMCGLMLPFIASAALWQRQRPGGRGVHVDFSMLEAMLWTLAGPVLEAQLGDAPPRPVGNLSPNMAPHGVYPSAGEDQWIGLAVHTDAEWQRLCRLVPGLASFSELSCRERLTQRAAIEELIGRWTRDQTAPAVEAMLIEAQIAAAPVVGTRELVEDAHLQARGFWERQGAGVLPGLPWRAPDAGPPPAAPEMGADTDCVLRDVLNLPDDDIARLRETGAIA